MLRPLHLSLPLYGLLLATAWIIPATTHAAGPPSGRDAYRSHCARCHQVDGSGVKGLYPTLRELDSRGDARAAMIAGVLQGRRGLLEQDGMRVDNLMPTHGFLGNEVIAATLSYALAAWSSAGEPVSTEEVAAARLALLAGHPVGAAEAAPGSSPLEDLQTFDYVTSEGPSMTVDEFTQARRLYYGRCTGCHGVLREGTAGNPLTPELMRERGTEYLQSVISYGSSRGMPGWGTTESLSARDINLLARFLQHPVPQPPDMNLAQIRDTWHLRRITSERPGIPQHGYDLNRLFVAALHDTGEIALFDGADKQLIARVEVGRAPHRIAASASGRYLYVIGRDGTLSLVDLFAMPPIRVASVRIGYEARTIAASAGPETAAAVVLAGACWPPQLVMLDGHTLEPLRLISTRGYTRDHRYHPEARVSDLATSGT
jgi:nitrite reductase (NO-forming)/hydroxylamine reductase